MADEKNFTGDLTREIQVFRDRLADLEDCPLWDRSTGAAVAGGGTAPAQLSLPAETIARWQRVVDAAARILRAPAGLITRVVGPELEVFVASATEGNPYRQGERVPLEAGVYCAAVIARRSGLLIPDARNDLEWRHGPEVNMGMCFYLGLPLAWSNGEIFGTICLLDRKENAGASSHEGLLHGLRAMVEGDLRLLTEERQRRRLEGELKGLEKKFRAYYHSSPIPTFTWQKRGEDLVLIGCNQAASIITKGNIHRYLGRSAAEIYQRKGDVHQDLWRCFTTKGVIKRQIRSQHFMPGRDLMITYVPVPSDLVVVHTEDVTEHKQAEEQLRTTLESIGDGFFVCDGDWRFVYVNAAAEGILGIRREEVLGKSHWEVFPLTLGTRLEREYRRAAAGEIRDFENFYEPWGRWFHNRCFPRGGGGMSVYFQDITERKRAEEALRTLTAELEERVARRTAQLEAANRELDAFAYSVSHDLRAPLRAMSGFSHLLLEYYSDNLDDQGRHYLQRMVQVSQRMGKLIDDLLALSRLARREMQRERVNLSGMARGIALELKEREPERRVHVVVAERLMAHGDPHLLRVVLENLLGNAWKFTARKPAATIEFGAIRQKGKRVYFVRDDGIGFDMAYAEKIFQAFQRLNPTNEFEGSGIGLATVERIIHRHGGRVWAEGEVGKGATFFFTLS